MATPSKKIVLVGKIFLAKKKHPPLTEIVKPPRPATKSVFFQKLLTQLISNSAEGCQMTVATSSKKILLIRLKLFAPKIIDLGHSSLHSIAGRNIGLFFGNRLTKNLQILCRAAALHLLFAVKNLPF